MQYPGLSAVGAQPFSLRLGGLAEASHQTFTAGPVASPIRLGGRPLTMSITNQASHLVHLPNSPLDGGNAVMQPAAPVVAESRVVLSTPPKAKARVFLKRSKPPPETLSPPGPCVANKEGEVAMPRQQLLEANG